jgi:hypothetical protein
MYADEVLMMVFLMRGGSGFGGVLFECAGRKDKERPDGGGC